jgi:hypothetical protein
VSSVLWRSALALGRSGRRVPIQGSQTR